MENFSQLNDLTVPPNKLNFHFGEIQPWFPQEKQKAPSPISPFQSNKCRPSSQMILRSQPSKLRPKWRAAPYKPSFTTMQPPTIEKIPIASLKTISIDTILPPTNLKSLNKSQKRRMSLPMRTQIMSNSKIMAGTLEFSADQPERPHLNQEQKVKLLLRRIQHQRQKYQSGKQFTTIRVQIQSEKPRQEKVERHSKSLYVCCQKFVFRPSKARII